MIKKNMLSEEDIQNHKVSEKHVRLEEGKREEQSQWGKKMEEKVIQKNKSWKN